MNRSIFVLLLLLVMPLMMASRVQANVITFDDRPGSLEGTFIDLPYGGFQWTNTFVVDTSLFGGPDFPGLSGIPNGVTSGVNVALNGFGNQLTISNSVFDFNGAYLTAAWNSGLNIEVRAFSGGTLAYDRTVVVDSFTPTFFRFEFLGIDTLTFDSFGGTQVPFYEGSGEQFVMDDFTYNEPVSSIPEPGSIMLISVGLIAAGCFSRLLMKYDRRG